MIEKLWNFVFGTRERVVLEFPDPERAGRVAAMRDEQLRLQDDLGIDRTDDAQAWLRLHQLLKSHEDRIAALEERLGQ